MSKPSFVYVTYINATAEKVWRALTDGEVTRRYWSNHRNASDWQPGSEWRHENYDDAAVVDVIGTVVESDPPRRLVVTWASPRLAADPTQRSQVSYDLAEDAGMVRLTVTHDDLQPGSSMEKGISEGWPMVLSSLKTFLETGEPMPPIMVRKNGAWSRERFAPAPA